MAVRKRRRVGSVRSGIISRTYSSWRSMVYRCIHDDRYVNRGINICERWQIFTNFLEDMGARPEGKTIERIDNDKGYYKENCKWATPTEQARNRSNNRLDFQSAYECALLMYQGFSSKEVAARFDCSENLPNDIMKGRTWKDAREAALEYLRKENPANPILLPTDNMTVCINLKIQIKNRYGVVLKDEHSHNIEYFYQSENQANEIILKTKKSIQAI